MADIRKKIVLLLVLSSYSLIGSINNKRSFASAAFPETNLGITEKRSISQTLRENENLPIEKRIALYKRLKKEHPDAYNFEDENDLNMYGYSLLYNNKKSEALEIFKLLVSEFPNSSNAYDSLGEGYLMNGYPEESLVNYRKSLALDPENFNANDQIDKIKYPEKKPELFIDKMTRVYTAVAYKEDLDQLGKKLTSIHPNALKFISEDAFNQLIESKKALVSDNTTYSEFYWHCLEIVASIGCSHTTMGRFFEEGDLPLSVRFPLKTRWVDGHLFVTDPANNKNKVALKDEIVSINGIPVAQLVNEIYKRIESQGKIQTTKRHVFNIWATGMIPFALGFPATYEIRVKGKNTVIRLDPAQSPQIQRQDPSVKPCPERLCFEISDDAKTAILTVKSFNYYRWDDLNVFEAFIDRSFREIKEKNIKNLIVDLRFNGGGSPESSIYLLKHLKKEPFPYFSNSDYVLGHALQQPVKDVFDGKCYFIIDGNGKSTTGHFMSLVKIFQLGTIVGEELGSNQFCTAGQKICRLPNTGMEYYIANSTSESAAPLLPDETGILPDHFVSQSITDYLKRTDAVLEYTIRLTEK